MSSKTEEKKTMKQRWNDFKEKHPNVVAGVITGVSLGAVVISSGLVGYEIGKKKMSKYVLPQDKDGCIKELLYNAMNRYPDDFNLMTLCKPEDGAIKVSDLGKLGEVASEMFDNYDPNKEYTHFLAIGGDIKK